MRLRLSIVVLVASLAAILVPTASAQTFYWSDPVNDAPSGAPDLTTTTAAIDTNGLITWNLSSTVPGAFEAQTAVTLRINSDGSMATGYEGADYAISVVGGYVGLYVWNGSVFALVPNAPGLTANLGFPETITLHTSAIGSPRSIYFQVYAYGQAPYSENSGDVAPGAPYWWLFDTSTPNQAPGGVQTTAPTSTAVPAPTSNPVAAPSPTSPAPSSTSTPTTTPTPPASPPVSATATTKPPTTFAPKTPKLPFVPSGPRLQVHKTSIRVTGRNLTISANFRSSIAGAKGSCSVSTGNRQMGTLTGHASGKTLTCRGVFNGRAPHTFKTVMTVKVGGSTLHIPIGFSSSAGLDFKLN